MSHKAREIKIEMCVLASGLVDQGQLGLAQAELRADPFIDLDDDSVSSDELLADKLVERGYINAWQASQLLDGRTKFTLGPYRIVDSLGRGGMGQVFKAEHAILARTVAVKVLPQAKSTPEAIANFQREMRAQASLDHANLVRALDAGEDGNVYYLVSEYVPGCDLRKLVRRDGRLDMYTAANVITQVAAGLQHAHEQGLIHRDVKPGNVLVTPDMHAKLSDLGLAGPLGGDAETDPRFGKIVGTADYLSPDHITAPWEPKPVWDIYSLGCTLYFAVTGTVPFPKGTTKDKAKAHCELRPLDPRRQNRGLAPAFVELIADMMAKDPRERIQSAREVSRRLARWNEQREAISLDNLFPAPSPSVEPVEEGILDDTQESFSKMPEAGSGVQGETSQSTETVCSAMQETSIHAVPPPDARDQGPCSTPTAMAATVLLPVGLVTALAVVWWLAQMVM